MAIVADFRNGLSNWIARDDRAKVLALPSRASELCWLRDTPLYVAEEAWLGQRVVDRRGRFVGKVRDVVLEVRSMEEAIRADGPRGWGVRAAFAAVESGRGWRWWSKPREVLLAAFKLSPSVAGLEADLDVVDLWPRLFGADHPLTRG